MLRRDFLKFQGAFLCCWSCPARGCNGVSKGSATPDTAVATGDTFRCFFAGRGRFVMVLSDGMGTGGSAAVDSAMTADLLRRLIEAGVGCDAALKIVNSALLLKSGEETLATADVAEIDLYTGRARFYKA